MNSQLKNLDPGVPLSNAYQDITLQRNPLTVNTGNVGPVLDNNFIADSLLDCAPNLASMPKHYSHWFSGGEFTLTYPGLNCLSFGTRGSGSILNIYPPLNAPSYYQFCYSTKQARPLSIPSETVKDFTGGAPKDTIIGDYGVCNFHGYSMGILSAGPAFISANPFTSIQLFDINNSIKINAFTYDFNSAGGTEKIRSNYKICNESKVWSDKPERKEENFLFYENWGCTGNIYNKGINSFYYSTIKSIGTSITKSASDIVLSTGPVPTIKKILDTYNPLKNEPVVGTSKEFYSPNLASELDYSNGLDNYMMEQYETQSTSTILASMVKLRKDGTIVLMSKNGSCIEIGEDITIVAAKDIKLQAGNNLVCISGGDTGIFTHKNILLSAANLDAHIQEQAKIEADKTTIDSDLDTKGGTWTDTTKMVYHNNNLHSTVSRDICEESVSKNIKSNNIVCSVQNELSVISSSTNIDSPLNIHGSYLYWTGGSFSLYGTQTGTIKAATPIRMNHYHSTNTDKITYKVYSIKGGGQISVPIRFSTENVPAVTKAMSMPNLYIQTNNSILDVSVNKLAGSTFYEAPCQTLQGTTWDLSDELGQNLLRGKGNAIIPWSKYKIYGE